MYLAYEVLTNLSGLTCEQVIGEIEHATNPDHYNPVGTITDHSPWNR